MIVMHDLFISGDVDNLVNNTAPNPQPQRHKAKQEHRFLTGNGTLYRCNELESPVQYGLKKAETRSTEAQGTQTMLHTKTCNCCRAGLNY